MSVHKINVEDQVPNRDKVTDNSPLHNTAAVEDQGLNQERITDNGPLHDCDEITEIHSPETIECEIELSDDDDEPVFSSLPDCGVFEKQSENTEYSKSNNADLWKRDLLNANPNKSAVSCPTLYAKTLSQMISPLSFEKWSMTEPITRNSIERLLNLVQSSENCQADTEMFLVATTTVSIKRTQPKTMTPQQVIHMVSSVILSIKTFEYKKIENLSIVCACPAVFLLRNTKLNGSGLDINCIFVVTSENLIPFLQRIHEEAVASLSDSNSKNLEKRNVKNAAINSHLKEPVKDSSAGEGLTKKTLQNIKKVPIKTLPGSHVSAPAASFAMVSRHQRPAITTKVKTSNGTSANNSIPSDKLDCDLLKRSLEKLLSMTKNKEGGNAYQSPKIPISLLMNDSQFRERKIFSINKVPTTNWESTNIKNNNVIPNSSKFINNVIMDGNLSSSTKSIFSSKKSSHINVVPQYSTSRTSLRLKDTSVTCSPPLSKTPANHILKINGNETNACSTNTVLKNIPPTSAVKVASRSSTSNVQKRPGLIISKQKLPPGPATIISKNPRWTCKTASASQNLVEGYSQSNVKVLATNNRNVSNANVLTTVASKIPVMAHKTPIPALPTSVKIDISKCAFSKIISSKDATPTVPNLHNNTNICDSKSLSRLNDNSIFIPPPQKKRLLENTVTDEMDHEILEAQKKLNTVKFLQKQELEIEAIETNILRKELEISALKKKCRELKSKCKSITKRNYKSDQQFVEDILSKYVDQEGIRFFTGQMQVLPSIPGRNKWSDEDKMFALGILYKNPKTYYLLVEKYAFPPVHIISQFVAKIKSECEKS